MTHPDLFSTPPTHAERLTGSVERITFHSPETGFCVLRVRVRGHRDLVAVVGSAASVAPGEFVEAEGAWINDRNHGLQFKARHLEVVAPSTLEGIEKYLGSGMVRGIGPHFAKKLVRAFGDKVFDVIEHQPERLTELPGIGPKRKQRVTSAWAEQKVIREIMVFLQSHGVGTTRAVRIYKTYGDTAIDTVRDNPYRLALDIRGIGFKTADTLAQKLGIAPDALIRAEAGVRHVLQEFATQGHCAATRENLLDTAADTLDIPQTVLNTALEREILQGNVVPETVEGESWVFLAALHRAEEGVAEHLKRLLQRGPPWGKLDLEAAIPWVERRTGLTLSESQRLAVTRACRAKVTVITGGPGVGKTTVVNSILQILRAKGVKVVLAAPTGRAAKRMTETTGIPAKTLHRLLEFDPKEGGFKRNQDSPLDAELVVLDEVSMVDVVLAHQLLRAIPDRAALMLVGDVDQLPSVGPGAVLSDIIRSHAVATVRLTEIFRQAASSRIIVNAHRINLGSLPERPPLDGDLSDFYLLHDDTPEAIHAKLLHLVTERIPGRFGLDPVGEIQVLSPRNGGGLGARSLNLELQKLLNPDQGPRIQRFGWTFAPGDKVVQTVNNYDKEVFNGDVGRISKIDPEEGVVLIDFDGRPVEYEVAELDEVDLAYAMTVHKSQGSEYPAVVLPIAMQHYTLLERNLLYTAVTRGKRLVVVVAEPRALAMAVRTRRSGRRLTRLAARLAPLQDPGG